MPDEPPPKPLVWTRHALANFAQRAYDVAWIEATVRTPEWREPDPNDPEVERRFRRVPEAGNRILRVPCVETDEHIRIVSFHFDRKAAPPDD